MVRPPGRTIFKKSPSLGTPVRRDDNSGRELELLPAFFNKILVKGNELYEGHYTDLFGAIFSEGSNNFNLVDLSVCYSNLAALDELIAAVSK